MGIYVCVCVRLYIFIYTLIYVYLYTHVDEYLYTWGGASADTFVCKRTWALKNRCMFTKD